MTQSIRHQAAAVDVTAKYDPPVINVRAGQEIDALSPHAAKSSGPTGFGFHQSRHNLRQDRNRRSPVGTGGGQGLRKQLKRWRVSHQWRRLRIKKRGRVRTPPTCLQKIGPGRFDCPGLPRISFKASTSSDRLRPLVFQPFPTHCSGNSFKVAGGPALRASAGRSYHVCHCVGCLSPVATSAISKATGSAVQAAFPAARFSLLFATSVRRHLCSRSTKCFLAGRP